MSSEADCPAATELVPVVSEPAYGAFEAGWRAGTIRRATQPAPQHVIEEIATMLDAALVADTLTRPE